VRRAGGAMVIREPGTAAGSAGAGAGETPASQQMDADMDFARQVQAQMDAEEARRECVSAARLCCCTPAFRRMPLLLCWQPMKAQLCLTGAPAALDGGSSCA
jgi:hypothetical protein